MKTYHLYLIAMIFISCDVVFADSPKNKEIVIVSSDNKVTRLAWRDGLTIAQVILLDGGFADHFSCSVIDAQTIRFYGADTSRESPFLDDSLHVGDLIVMGLINSKRASELDKIPEVTQSLGCRWENCEKRVNRTSAPIPFQNEK